MMTKKQWFWVQFGAQLANAKALLTVYAR
ncbi:hypothetical protein CH1034_140006 [Klebsiella pneumoniae]|nr:hypothetical protein CH1034_140006 [Klebsiella pneumoniae]